MIVDLLVFVTLLLGDFSVRTPAHAPWPLAATCEHNTVGGPGGWVCVQDGIPADRECVVPVSAVPHRALVVGDDSVLCQPLDLDPVRDLDPGGGGR